MLFMGGALAAQNSSSEAPIVWERYRVSGSDVSIKLPKLPTRGKSYQPCEETETGSYYAYADDVIYELTIRSKSNRGIPQSCDEKRPFGPTALNQRLARLRLETPAGGETSGTLAGKALIKFVRPSTSRWIVSDIKNGRWVEIAISRRVDSKVDEETLIDSLELESKAGKDIGEGSSVILGDQGVKSAVIPTESGRFGILNTGNSSGSENAEATNDKTNVPNKDQEKKPEFDPLTIIAKPQPSYTEEAKTENVQGLVRLKVTFLASGGIGEVSTISGLPAGLTEQAINAAKKMAFLPKRVNKMPVSVVRVVEFSFTIY